MGSIRPRSVAEYAQMLWRRKLIFLSIAGATMIAAYIIISRLPDTFESKAAIVVTSKMDDRQSIADRVAAVRERLSSRALLESVAQRHLLASSSTNQSMDLAINRLRKDIKVETFMRGDFPERLSLTYKNDNPQVAKDVATDLVAVFGSMNEALEKQLADETENLNAELNDVETRLTQISQRSIYRGSGGSSRPRIDLNAVRAERSAAQSSIETLTDKQFSLEREIAQQKQQIAEQQKIVKAAPSEARSSSSYGVLLVRKAELQAQIKDYTAQYTDQNPKVIQARAQLDEINRQIAQLSTEAQGGGAANSTEARELRTLERELARMETELAITNRAIERKQQAIASSPTTRAAISSNVPTISTPVASTAAADAPVAGNNVERLKNRYDSLLRRQERLQNVRATAAGLDPGLFQIVDMPAVPEIPTGPNRLKLLGLALILALALGLAVVIILEIPKLYSIHDDRDVEYYLGAPVIVLIPETLTPSERGHAKRLLAMRVVGMLILTLIIIPVLIFLFSNLKVFQLLASR